MLELTNILRRPSLLVLALWALSGCSDATISNGCAEHGDCARGQLCIANICSPARRCTDDLACGAGEVCENGACAQVLCRTEADCGDGRICQAGLCAVPPAGFCQDDTDCVGGTCDLEMQRCRLGTNGCGDGPACPEGEVCEDDVCFKPECLGDDDCRPGLYCTADRACVAGCRMEDGACGEGRICDAETHTCTDDVECLADADCPMARYCDVGGACSLGCRVDPDNCTERFVCDPASHACIPGPCGSDDACEAGLYCGDDGECATGCRLDPDSCGVGRACDAELRACADVPCPDDAACDEGQYCDAGVCQAGCREGGCDADQRCDLERRACACVADTACPDGQYCAEGGCVDGCSAGTCPEADRCDLDTHICALVEGRCHEDTDCAAAEYCGHDLTCADGCRVGGCDEGQRCDVANRECVVADGRCVDDLGCPGDEYCGADLRCAPGCRVDGCPAGQACDLQTRACACDEDLGCAEGSYCEDGACLEGCRVEPDTCPGDVACDPVSHQCGCALDTDCAEAEYCAQGVCALGCRLLAEGDAPDNCGVGRCGPEHTCDAIPCQVQGQCDPDQVCRLLPASAGGLELGCAHPEGGTAPEAPCALNPACATGLCLSDDRTCYAACLVDGDCASGYCAVLTVTGPNPGDETVARSCAAAPLLCEADAMCADGRACLPVGMDPDVPARPELMCVAPPEGAATGAACVADADCASDACLFEGLCWGPCRPDVANDCQPGQLCYDNELYFIANQGTATEADDVFFGMAGCAPDIGSGEPCDAENNCATFGEICNPSLDQRRLSYDAICLDAVGGGLGGAACVAGDDCRTGVCLNDGYCLGLCDPNADLVGLLSQCNLGAICLPVSFRVWDRGTADTGDDVSDTLNICVPL